MTPTTRILGWSGATLLVILGAVMAVAYLYATVDFVRAQHERRAGSLYGHPATIVQREPGRETL